MNDNTLISYVFGVAAASAPIWFSAGWYASHWAARVATRRKAVRAAREISEGVGEILKGTRHVKVGEAGGPIRAGGVVMLGLGGKFYEWGPEGGKSTPPRMTDRERLEGLVSNVVQFVGGRVNLLDSLAAEGEFSQYDRGLRAAYKTIQDMLMFGKFDHIVMKNAPPPPRRRPRRSRDDEPPPPLGRKDGSWSSPRRRRSWRSAM